MAYPVPSEILMQGHPHGNDVRWYTEPTASIRADMGKGSGESLKRRMEVEYSTSPTGPWSVAVDTANGYKSPSTAYRGNVFVGHATGKQLTPDTKYYYRVYARRTDGTVGSPYASGSMLSPWAPSEAGLSTPTNESDIPVSLLTVDFNWDYSDEGGQAQDSAYFDWRVAQTPQEAAGPWTTYVVRKGAGTGDQAWEWYDEEPCFPETELWDEGCAPSPLIAYSSAPTRLTLPTSLFQQNARIEWRVRNVNDTWRTNGPITRTTQEGQDVGPVTNVNLHPGPEGTSKFFTVTGPTSPPLLISPTDDEGVVVSDDIEFVWRFRDPVEGTTQTNALLRYRDTRDDDWTYVDLGTDYEDETYTLAPNVLDPATHYEWQVQTTNDRGEVSDWSLSAFFWGIVQPGGGLVDPVVGDPLGALGCGTHRVFIYDRGGINRRGEITNLTRVIWERRRDDISEASIVVNDWDEDCGYLLTNTHTWQHEMVIYRTNEQGIMERVWEGPIVRLTYKTDEVEVHAKDPMVYVYRRVLRQGYNDAFRLVNGVQQGLKTVIYRAKKIITNALAYDDPNLIQYITTYEFDDDARTSRVVEAYSKTAWEEVDDLAATAGLDYTTVGRRIVLNDTHRQIGLLPEMRDGDFGDDPIVSEYGMQLANYFAVTNNAGVYGDADRLVNGEPEFYGFIEQLASAYGEAEGAPTEEVLTPQAKAELEAILSEQAERNISGRYPAPVIVRVPDNTTLSPDVPVGVNQLVPGVWLPVRSVGTLREVTQMQKLDYVRMTEERGTEVFTITLSPAPSPASDEEPAPEEV